MPETKNSPRIEIPVLEDSVAGVAAKLREAGYRMDFDEEKLVVPQGVEVVLISVPNRARDI